MVTEAADQGRWCALDLIRAASIFTRSTHLCVLWALCHLPRVSGGHINSDPFWNSWCHLMLDSKGRDTPFQAAMKARLAANNLIVAGYSAGAAVMSDPMIGGGSSGSRQSKAHRNGSTRRHPPPKFTVVGQVLPGCQTRAAVGQKRHDRQITRTTSRVFVIRCCLE